MYYSITEAVGTGSPVSVAVPPYIVKDHIKVYVDGLPTEGFDWVNDQTIMVVAALNRLIRVVRRTSPDARLTRFLNGVPLPGETLEVDSKQAFFLAQEAYDLTLASGGSLGQNLGPGVELTTEGIKQLLAGQITPSLLEQQLRMEIGLVASDETVAGSPAWRVAQEAAVRAAALVAEAQARNAALLAEAAERGAAIQSETTERQAALESLAQQLVTLTASLNGANAAVQTEMTARVDADEALGSRIDTVSASALDNAAAITAEANARANADNAIATAVEEVKAELEGADADLAARITSVESAYVDADEANAAAIQTVKASVDNDLSPRVAAVETTASTFASRVGTVESNYSLKVQARADGKFAFAGIGLSATAGGATPTQSEMLFAADKFTFVPSMADMNAVPQPLLVMGLVNGQNSLIVPPSRWGDRMVEARMIVDGGIEARHLKVSGGGSVLNDDPNFQDPSAWEQCWTPAGTVYGAMPLFGTTAVGLKSETCIRSTTTPPYGSSCLRSKRPIPVAAGERYVLRVQLYGVSAGNGFPNGNIYIRLAGSSTSTFATITELLSTGEGLMHTSPWAQFRVEFTIPAGVIYVKPELFLNWGGTQGYHAAQDFRLERLIDSAVIVEGGIKSDRLDTRGLTVKDAAGNVILGAGTTLSEDYIPASAKNNLMDASWWVLGASPSRWGLNPTGDGGSNTLLPANNVTNGSEILWRCVQGAGAVNGGGWDAHLAPGNTIKIDQSKCYRFVIPVWRYASTSAYSYWGCRWDDVSNLNTTTPNPNPYFAVIPRGAVAGDRWYLLVGYVFPYNSTGNTNDGAGVYDTTTGARLIAGSNYQWSNGATVTASRAYQYYGDQGSVMWFGKPRVDLVDGSEVPLEALLAQGAVSARNPLTASNASSYIANAAIDLAHINRASIGSLSAITATIGTLRTATGGARTEIYDNVIKVYDSSNVLRVKLGNLDL
ncbi:phage tail fiber protein [Rhizobacter sp. Root1221]|uniref:phage tail fiber domain-containing protein n=1 Tax=Rhizobacter sp. Root1221 TaxID=1736433 RepID=UPI000AD51C11|nr:phage tail fiber protein [Rhizobacter sp. Root1221]